MASGVLGAAALTCAAIAGQSVRVELRSLHATSNAVPRVADDAWFDSVKDLDLRTPRGVVLRGWLRGSTNGAAVLLVNGSGADRRQLLPEAHLLSAAGYGVLMFDRPGNGESGGDRYRGDEADFLRVAVDTLASERSLRPGEIGGYGFSSGAAFLAEAAASDPRLRAVILAGCYTDGDEYIRHFGGRGPISGVPGLWAVEWEKATLPHPLARVPGIAPRALFFIAGDEDSIVPADLSQQLYAAASEPKELWIIHGARHGEYRQVAGDEFGRRMVAFYDRALLGHER
jgi:alpha-beta hydrolase superfamily lysophospholipase